VVCADKSEEARYLNLLYTKTINELLRQSNLMQKQISEIQDQKAVILGSRYNLKEAKNQID
jgi:hypothetical protein